MKRSIVFIAIFGMLFALQAPAKENFNRPFMYLECDTPPVTMTETDAYWFIKANVAQTLIGITKISDETWQAAYVTGTGAGITLERSIKILGKWYNSFSVSGDLIFVPNGIASAAVSGGLLFGVQLPLLGSIAVGPRFDGKHTSLAFALSAAWSGKLF